MSERKTDMEKLLQYVDETGRDLDDHCDESEAFLAGYAYARHTAKSYYLTYSDEAPGCECPSVGFPEERSDGTWTCADCGTVVERDDTWPDYGDNE